jgi:uncharacterized membrane protein
MHSQDVTVVIEQPFDQVYGFLADPLNFPSWGPVQSTEIHHLHGSDWLVEINGGPMVLRFSAPNLDGILDYWMFGPGQAVGNVVPVRLTQLGEACQITLTWTQPAGVSDELYASQLDVALHYLTRLKRLLESEPGN